LPTDAADAPELLGSMGQVDVEEGPVGTHATSAERRGRRRSQQARPGRIGCTRPDAPMWPALRSRGTRPRGRPGPARSLPVVGVEEAGHLHIERIAESEEQAVRIAGAHRQSADRQRASVSVIGNQCGPCVGSIGAVASNVFHTLRLKWRGRRRPDWSGAPGWSGPAGVDLEIHDAVFLVIRAPRPEVHPGVPRRPRGRGTAARQPRPARLRARDLEDVEPVLRSAQALFQRTRRLPSARVVAQRSFRPLQVRAWRLPTRLATTRRVASVVS